MSDTLEDFFVSIGVKGQNDVLSNISKIKKEATSLSKLKPVFDMGKGNALKAMAGIKSITGAIGESAKNQIFEKKLSPKEEKRKKEEDRNTRQFSEGAKKFGNATKDFASSAATFDPLTVIKSVTSGIGESLSGISILGVSLGQLPKGIADVTNSLVDMASGALKIAKESAAGQYNLSRRNATTEYYGGENVNKGRMSNAEHADLVMSISSAFGKIQKPMQNVLNELVNNKDTAALSRVASGNWESTGEDKGWMLQQITNQTAGLPPSIAQAIQTSLLKNNSELIQSNKGEEGQSINASYESEAEKQTARLFEVTSANFENFKNMNSSLNAMQIQLVNTGVQFAGAIVTATNALAKLPETIDKINKKIDSALSKVPEWARPDTVRIGK